MATAGCTSGFMELDTLKKRAEKITSGNTVSRNILDDELRVIPELNFTCSGTITGLLLGVDVRAIDDDIDEYPELQIWREYQGLIYDYDRKSTTTIAPKGGDFSPDGVLQHNLTAPIQFQSGDILGVYQPREFSSVARLFYAYDTNAPVSIVKSKNYNSVYSFGSTRSNQYVLIFPIIGTSPLILKNNNFFTYNCTDPPGCTSNAFLTPEELRQKVLEVNINSVVVRDQQQRVFPDITFTCNGSITKWIVGAGTGGGSSPPSELQIWRRSGSDYTKVGFTQLTAQNSTNNSNVYEYIPSPPMEFQEGDILGVYQRDESSIVPYYQESTGPENLRQNGLVSAAPVNLTAPSLAAEYDYPLVTVEISEQT